MQLITQPALNTPTYPKVAPRPMPVRKGPGTELHCGAYVLHLVPRLLKVAGKSILLARYETFSFLTIAEAPDGVSWHDLEIAFNALSENKRSKISKPANFVMFLRKKIIDHLQIDGFDPITITGVRRTSTTRYHLNQPPV